MLENRSFLLWMSFHHETLILTLVGGDADYLVSFKSGVKDFFDLLFFLFDANVVFWDSYFMLLIVYHVIYVF